MLSRPSFFYFLIFSLFGTIAAEDGRQWAVAILFVYKLVYKCWTLPEEVDRYGIFESRFGTIYIR